MAETTVADARRVLIRAHVKQIPGSPNSRPWALWSIFCERVLHRDPSMSSGGTDFVHVLPGFDSQNDTKAWFLVDVGVNERQRNPVDIATLPHDVYLAHFDFEKNEWTFVERPGLTKGYREYFKRWSFGNTDARSRENVSD